MLGGLFYYGKKVHNPAKIKKKAVEMEIVEIQIMEPLRTFSHLIILEVLLECLLEELIGPNRKMR